MKRGRKLKPKINTGTKVRITANTSVAKDDFWTVDAVFGHWQLRFAGSPGVVTVHFALVTVQERHREDVVGNGSGYELA